MNLVGCAFHGNRALRGSGLSAPSRRAPANKNRRHVVRAARRATPRRCSIASRARATPRAQKPALSLRPAISTATTAKGARIKIAPAATTRVAVYNIDAAGKCHVMYSFRRDVRRACGSLFEIDSHSSETIRHSLPAAEMTATFRTAA